MVYNHFHFLFFTIFTGIHRKYSAAPFGSTSVPFVRNFSKQDSGCDAEGVCSCSLMKRYQRHSTQATIHLLKRDLSALEMLYPSILEAIDLRNKRLNAAGRQGLQRLPPDLLKVLTAMADGE